MKKKITTILLVLALLTACGTQAPAAPPTVEVPDIETIIRQSVDEAVQEKTKEYEEEQKKKDQEIAELKAQIENLAAQSEAPPERACGEVVGPISRGCPYHKRGPFPGGNTAAAGIKTTSEARARRNNACPIECTALFLRWLRPQKYVPQFRVGEHHRGG